MKQKANVQIFEGSRNTAMIIANPKDRIRYKYPFFKLFFLASIYGNRRSVLAAEYMLTIPDIAAANPNIKIANSLKIEIPFMHHHQSKKKKWRPGP